VGVRNGKAGIFKMWNVFEAIHIDGCEMPLSSKGAYRHMLTVVDRSSRLVELIPLRTKSAKDVARALLERWICRYGAPSIIFCDQDTAYQSVLVTELTKNAGGKVVSFSPYSHHNGLAEAFNRTGCAIIRSMIASEGLESNRWNEILPAVMYVLNTTVSSEIGVSAMGYVYGREPARLASRRMPEVLRGDNWNAILKASLKAMQRVRTAANYRRYAVEVESVMKRNQEQKRKKTTGYEKDEAVWVWFFEDSKKIGKVDASHKWRRGTYVRPSFSRRSHWVYVSGRLFKKSDMHIHPRVPTINRCLVGQLVEETMAETSDESDVEEKVRRKVREQRRIQEEKDDVRWCEYYNLGSDPPVDYELVPDSVDSDGLAAAQNEEKINLDEPEEMQGEKPAGNDIDQQVGGYQARDDGSSIEQPELLLGNELPEKRRSKKSKKRAAIDERNLSLVKFTILESEDGKKVRVLTLQTGKDDFHCFTRSKKSVRGRWRYQPTYFVEVKGKSVQHYSDRKKEHYQEWLLHTNGWRVADTVFLPYRAEEHFSVSETERCIIEEGRDKV